MRALQRARAAVSPGAPQGLSRREMLAGGAGAGALLALPDLSLASRPGARYGREADLATPGSRYVLLYGTPESTPFPGGSVASALSPASRVRSSAAVVSASAGALPRWNGPVNSPVCRLK